MNYKVIAYDEINRAHRVEDSKGNKRLVDLMTDGDFPEDIEPEALEGKTFVADSEFPYIAIAMGVRQVELEVEE